MKNTTTTKILGIVSILGVLSTTVLPSVYAQTSVIAPSTSTSSDKMIAPIPNYGTSYSYDEAILKSLVDNRKSYIYKVGCSVDTYLKSTGLSNSELVSFTLSKNLDGRKFDFNYDIRNCTLNGYLNNDGNYYVQPKPVKEADALKFGDTFIKNSIKGKGIVYESFGTPIVSKNNYYMMYGVADKATSSEIGTDIVVDETDVTNIEKEYSSISITYPFVINNMNVYDNYGNVQGVTLTVDGSGVNNVSVSLMKFKLVKKTADKASLEDIKSYINRGGNNGYYGGVSNSVTLDSIKSGLVLFNIQNSTDRYLSSGVILKSSKTKTYNDTEYVLPVSDYKVGNSGM